MADIRVSLILNGNQYIGELNRATVATERFKDKAESAGMTVSSGFSKLSVMAGSMAAAMVALGAKTMAYADQVTDLADAYGTSIGNVVALTKALEQAGGKGDNAGRVFLEMSKSINEANQGNLKTLSTFERLGISISDLGNLSDTEIRNKLIRALADMPAGVERTALQFQLFGKALNGVDIRRLSTELEGSQGKYDQYARSLKTAGDAADNLSAIMGNIKLAFAQAFEPIFKVISAIRLPIDEAAAALTVLGAALSTVFGAVVIAGLTKVVGLIKMITVASMRSPLIAVATALAAIAVYAADATGFLDKMLGLQQGNAEAAANTAEATGEATRNQDGLNEKLSKARETLTKIGEQQAINNQSAIDRLKLESEGIFQTENRKAIIQEVGKIEADTQQKILDLKKAFNSLDAEMQGRVKGEYQAQLEIIREQGDQQKQNVAAMMEGIQATKMMMADINGAFGILNDAEAKLFKTMAGVGPVNEREAIAREESINAALQKRQIIMQEIAKQNYAPALQGIATEIMQGAKDYQQVITEFNRNTGNQYAQQVQQLVEGTSRQVAAVDTALGSLTNTRLKALAETRTFSYGWEQAFKKFTDDATNAARQAERLFGKFTQGIEDLIVNFVKTGKFQWKDFVNMMAEELLRSQIQVTLAKIMGAFGMGNTYSGSRNTGGYGQSGYGQGLTGASGLTSLLGLSNNMGYTGGGDGLIGGLFNKFKSMFSGLFADGGYLGAGKWGIAGEAGPEIISGPAQITPMLAGASYVTYNINAVDAMSFKQLVAADPQFIHAVAQQGARSIPSTRR